MINGNRVKQARELCGWTQKELAARVGIKQPTLAQIENGIGSASARIVQSVAELTDFQEEFFERPDTVEFSLGSLLFRAHAAATARQRTEAYRHAQLMFEIHQRLAVDVTTLPVQIPKLREDAITAARIARVELGISPDKPIPYLVNSAERNGAVVLAIPVELEKRDAFSLWAGDERKAPVIAVSSGKPGDRTHWNMAHELGHLVLHNPAEGILKDLDRDADRFAAEFLMPETAMREEISNPVTLENIARLKLRWKVAMQALIRRAFELKIVTERQYRYLFEQIIWNGWRTKEPVSVPTEKPRALRKMAEEVYGDPIDFRQMSKDTGVGLTRLRQIIAAHAEKPNRPAPSAPPSTGRLLEFSRKKERFG